MDPEELLRHTAFLRRLARSLLADAHLAEDAVQEACLAALRRPPRHRGNVRAWLAALTRNVARKLLRTRRRRRRREEAVARPVAVRPAPDRDADIRAVVHALCELREPYRDTLLLRFFEDLPPREIARRHNVPVHTVRTRVRRGIDELRRRLDRRVRCAWFLPVPWLGRRGRATAATVAACATLSVTWLATGDPARAAPRATMRVAATDPATPAPFTVATGAHATRADAPPRARVVVTGRVRGLRGPAPVAVAAVCKHPRPLPPPATGATDPDGRFAVDVTPLAAALGPWLAELEVRLESPDHLPARARVPVDGRARYRCSLRAIPARTLAGRVEGDVGWPVPGATVGSFPLAGRCPAPRPVDTAVTSADGSFRLRGRADRAHLVVAVARGYEPGAAPGPAPLLVLGPGAVVEGRVSLAGRPAAGATVAVESLEPGTRIELGGVALLHADGFVERARAVVTTGPDGRFRAAGLAVARHRVRPADPAWALLDADRVVRAPARVELDVDAAFVVVDGAARLGPARVEGAGAFALPPVRVAELRAGTWLRRGVRGPASGETRAETVAPPADAPLLEVTLARVVGDLGIGLDGLAYDVGAPVRTLRAPAPAPGRYFLRLVPGGLEAGHGYLLPFESVVDVPGQIRVTFEAGGRLRIAARARHGGIVPARCAVVDAAGRRLAVSFFRLRAAGGWDADADALPADGPAFVHPALPPGRYTLELEGDGLRPRSVETDVVAGEITDLDVLLEESR